MADNPSKLALAAHYHEQSYGCTQSVLASFAGDFGLDERLALRLATGFGSGMGRMCEVYGALTEAFMVIGLKYGKETIYQLVADTAYKFKARNSSIYCRHLIGHNLMDPEERLRVIELGLFKTTNRKYSLGAVEIGEAAL